MACKHNWSEQTDIFAISCLDCGIVPKVETELLPSRSKNGNIYGMIYKPTIYYGKLPTVIISHGFGANAVTSMAILLALRGYACYTFDFCGGSYNTRSDMEFQDMTILTEKDDLLAVVENVRSLDYVDTDRLYLYGESQGGLVTAITATEIQEKTAGMVLIYPGFSMFSDMAMKYKSFADIPETVDFLGHKLNRTYAEAIFSFLPDNFTPISQEGNNMQERIAVTKKAYEYVSAYKKKVLTIHGTNDPLVDIAFSRELIKYYDDSELLVIDGAGHGFAWDRLFQLAHQIDLFLKGN